MAKTKTAKTGTDALLMLDPEQILAENNARFGLDPLEVDRRLDSILEAGGIQQPVIVGPVNEEGLYPLTAGFYRVAAAKKANASGALLKVPAIVRPYADEKERLAQQLRENVERKDMTPMDEAVAIRKLLDSGVDKGSVRKLFARPTGRKKLELQPASNAWVNISLSFLDFPKDIQQKIHDGRLPFKAAYKLSRAPKDQWVDILNKAEALRVAEIEAEEKDEQKVLAEEQKAAKAAEKEGASTKKFAEATEAFLGAQEALANAEKEAREAAKAPENLLTLPEEEKKKIAARFKESQAALKLAQTAYSKAEQGLKKATEAENARLTGKGSTTKKAPAPAKKAAVKTEHVEKATAEVQGKAKPLTMKEIIGAVEALGKSRGKMTQAVAECLNQCFAGIMSVQAMVHEIEVLVGDRATKKG